MLVKLVSAIHFHLFQFVCFPTVLSRLANTYLTPVLDPTIWMLPPKTAGGVRGGIIGVETGPRLVSKEDLVVAVTGLNLISARKSMSHCAKPDPTTLGPRNSWAARATALS